MDRYKKYKRKVNSFLYNHYWLKCGLDYGTTLIMTVLSAAIFTFGIICFMKPDLGSGTYKLVTGGASGIAQDIVLFLEVCGLKFDSSLENLIFSSIFVIVNIPLAIIAFKGVGKRFAIFTVLNVGFVFLFTNIFKGQFFDEVAAYINEKGGLLARALFASLTTGLSSAIAFKFETSTGGLDIISYYVSLRKGCSVGPIGAIINGFVVAIYYLMMGLQGTSFELTQPITVSSGTIESISSWSVALIGTLFSVIYLGGAMLVIDAINVRNKKVQVQIITENEELPRYLLANVPHGATIIRGKGAYSGNERLIVYLVISTTELKEVIGFIKEIDPNSFVNVMSLQQVYGRFYMKPVK